MMRPTAHTRLQLLLNAYDEAVKRYGLTGGLAFMQAAAQVARVGWREQSPQSDPTALDAWRESAADSPAKAMKKPNRGVTIRCLVCGLEVTGVEDKEGLIRASNNVQPDLNAAIKSGLCMMHAGTP